MARLLLGVSGGIAAYKALELARLATLAGHGVRVLMTPTAERFVGRASFEGIVGAPVLGEEFERDPMRGAYPGSSSAAGHDPIGHLALAEGAEAMLVAPASANTLAKLAGGHADSMLTTCFLACPAPRLVAPAMNDRMWADPATQHNAEALRRRGVRVIEPEVGPLASRGERGAGRLPDPEALLAELEAALGGVVDSWAGLRVLVSAGGTREAIDGVRFIGNRSSGRMGIALAEAAVRRGASVELVAANVSLPSAAAIARQDVESAGDLGAALSGRFEACDVLLMAAAVADFRPDATHEGKLSREGEAELALRLEPTEDVLATLAARRAPNQVLVGFAAEHGQESIERARRKLARKAVDAIVFNDVSRADIGFDADANEVTIVEADGEHLVALAPKAEVADAVLDRVEALRSRVAK